MNTSDEDVRIIVPTISVAVYESTPMMKSSDTSSTQGFELITVGIIGTVILLFAVIGNTLSIIVWNPKSMRSTTGLYLIALSVTGLGHLLSFFLTESKRILSYPRILESYRYGVFYSYVGLPFYMLFVSCNI